MSIRLQQQVEELNRKVTEQDQRIEGLVQIVNELKAAREALVEMRVDSPKPSAKLCPKCNEAPGYFFHVRSCKGPKPA